MTTKIKQIFSTIFVIALLATTFSAAEAIDVTDTTSELELTQEVADGERYLW